MLMVSCYSFRLGAGIKDDKVERDVRGSKDSRAVPAPDANAELVMSLQVPEEFC